MKRTSGACFFLWLAIAWSMTTPSPAQIFPALGRPKGLPKIAVARDELPPLANPAYGEVLLSGNEALLEPAWLIGSLRDSATGQILKWNNYLRPDAKPNVKLLTEPVFEGFVDQSAVAKAEWLSTLKGQLEDRAVAEVVVTRVSVTSVEPKQIDRQRLVTEIVERLPADQQGRYGVVIAYVDVAITATRFQHHEIDGDFAGYGGRIGAEWYYKDKQKSTEHRLVAISAPLQFAVTGFGSQSNLVPAGAQRPCHELVCEAIKQGKLAPEKPRLMGVVCCSREAWPIGRDAPSSSPASQFVRQLFGSSGGAVANIMSERNPSDPLAESPSMRDRYAAAAAQRAAQAQRLEAARQAAVAAEKISASQSAAAQAPRRRFFSELPAAAAAASGPHSWSADSSSSSSSSRADQSYKAER